MYYKADIYHLHSFSIYPNQTKILFKVRPYILLVSMKPHMVNIDQQLAQFIRMIEKSKVYNLIILILYVVNIFLEYL